MNSILPIPENELERITKLSELDLDYSEIKDSFNDLARLAAKVVGTSISLVNLIDSFTQWTVSNYGLPLEQMTRADSVCQYTIVSKESFEIKDLSEDDRFKDKFYVSGPPRVRYYFGVPLQTSDGFHLGALCVLDSTGKEITPEKVELLKIIADYDGLAVRSATKADNITTGRIYQTILDKERRGEEQGKSGRQQERTTHESTLLVRRRALPTPVAA